MVDGRCDPHQAGGAQPAEEGAQTPGVGWDSAVGFCQGGPPVFNGVLQLVETPGGTVHILVHNADVPVMLFDVTEISGPEEFFARCAAGELLPLATGQAKQRPVINEGEQTASVKVASHGVVTDVAGRDWAINAFLKEQFWADGRSKFIESLKLRLL